MLRVTKADPPESTLCVLDLPHLARFRTKLNPECWWLKVDNDDRQSHRSVNLCTGVVWINGNDQVTEVLPPGESLTIGPDE